MCKDKQIVNDVHLPDIHLFASCDSSVVQPENMLDNAVFPT